ncbi:MAG TPA: VOC family protein [Ilumatobacter sp.]
MRMRLRQIVMVAADLEAAEHRVETQLDVELCYRDPGVGAFGLRNALFPIGEQLLEIVSPLREGTTAGRLLDKRGGDGGYMVILEVDDLTPLRERFEQLGVRVVLEAAVDGIVGLHLHPADVGGAILSVDRTDVWGEWPWAGPVWRQHVRREVVSAVLAVVVEAADPDAMAARWAEVLGRRADGRTVALDEGEIRFVPAGPRGEGVGGFVLRATEARGAGRTEICGCTFELVAP